MIAPLDRDALDETLTAFIGQLLDRRAAPDHWEGRLASSALSTATAVIALVLVAREETASSDRSRFRAIAEAGGLWLQRHQNPDGGWGDTTHSRSNISTTALVWAALSMLDARASAGAAHERSSAWLRAAAGDTTPAALREAILRRYGRDRTFSVPILTVLALAGKLGEDRSAAWRLVPQLPFELAALPHAWFQHLRLPVVSYALPALVAIGQARHHFAPTRNLPVRLLRNRLRRVTLDVIRAMQPESGGYLEATPLTSFVVMSLAAPGLAQSPVVRNGVRFLVDSVRDDGSWPIDTNLATWVTTLSVVAAQAAGALPREEARAVTEWLLRQQTTREHPFTHAAPGGWAWTPLSGGVVDADDTSGALVALHRLRASDAQAIAAGVGWLLGVQNRDGGIPTFCRGWGALRFDRSTPDITAHALQAWSAWYPELDPEVQQAVGRAAKRAVRFLAASQRSDGAWIPLWFGNEAAEEGENPTYGTARAILGLRSNLAREDVAGTRCCRLGTKWLLDAQNPDGGWGGARGVGSSIEETGVALAALGRCDPDERIAQSMSGGARWLIAASDRGRAVQASPLGLYFARLWYYEELYPLIFAIEGLAAASARLFPERSAATSVQSAEGREHKSAAG